MAVLQGRTRKQLRVAIGYNLSCLYVSALSSIGGAAGASIVDNTLRGPDDEHNGKWVLLTSGTLDGVLSRGDDYTKSTTTLTVLPAFASQVASAVTYELWDEAFSPTKIHDWINQAIMEATGHWFDPIVNLALHGDSRQYRFDIPTGISMVNRVEYRSSYESLVVHSCERVWDEKTDADFTVTVDTKDYKAGGSAVKVVVAAAASAGDSISDSLTAAVDISGYTHLEFWVKSTVATTAGQLQLLLDNTASVASPLETLDVPALVADMWTYARVALAAPKDDTAIISVGLKYTGDIGAVTIWLDEIIATHNDNARWTRVDPYHWRIDKETRDLVLDGTARSQIGSNLIKLTGGDIPALLSTDAGVTEVDDQFIIARVTGLALASSMKGPSTDPDGMNARASFWMGMAEQRKSAFPLLIDVRHVD